jgi:predicted RecB family nuclease
VHRRDGKLILSPTDLVGFLACGHLTHLERAAANGLVHKPTRSDDPQVELLRRRGGLHEERYLAQLKKDEREICDLRHERVEGEERDPRSYEERAAETEAAMRRGEDVIFQATVFDGKWLGHPDFLLRRPTLKQSGRDGELGRDFHYEVADTKLAHSAKASALIQICAYVEQVERIQGVQPERVCVVTGGAAIGEHWFRTAEMMAYYRHARRAFEQALDESTAGPPMYPVPRETSYPDPVPHCQVCKWFYEYCRQQWRDDDALPLVASISRSQRQALRAGSVSTVRALSELSRPFDLPDLKPKHHQALWKVREQARLQTASKEAGEPRHELVDPRDPDGTVPPNRGLTALPPPSPHDIFFDIEGDPFAFWQGLEYLFGIWEPARGEAGWQPIWALNREREKEAFEEVVDLFVDRWRANPDLHIYHYGSYEPGRIKRLAGRHATRQREVDDLLRGRVFVDLHQVVRQGVICGTEGYSIKNLEPFYGFRREVDLRTAGDSIAEFELWLDRRERGETGDGEQMLRDIERYNRDDCESTEGLRDWLEGLRSEGAALFGELPRPREESQETKEPTDWDIALGEITDRLTAGLAPHEENPSEANGATWLLANMLDFHRREDRASWWRFFELMEMTDDELFAESEPIGHLAYQGPIGQNRAGNTIHRFRFPVQEHKVGNRSELHDPRLPPFGDGDLGSGSIDKDELTLDITRPPEWSGPLPTSIVPYDRIPLDGLQAALVRFGTWVADNGIESPDVRYRAARDLLLRRPPRLLAGKRQVLRVDDQPSSQAARELAPLLDATTLAIQGPPGSGKTYSGARMVLALLADHGHKRVGVTGSSHKVVTNFLEAILKAAQEEEVSVEILQRIDQEDKEERAWATAKTKDKLHKMLADQDHDYRVIGGTVWLWARQDMEAMVDTLFVDEAGQVALANVVAASGSTRNVVLLGDPQQLDQVLQGSHPPGAEKSALGHYLGEAETVPEDRGLFLERTWRMHPDITRYTSQLYYEGRLGPVDGLDRQEVPGDDWLSGSGLRWVPIEHDGNSNASEEEAERVDEIVRALIGRDWVQKDGTRRPLGWNDIVIVSPYNAHRLLVQKVLGPNGRVGTVDKFQGQEAPVSIYTMATSRPEDAPRGMDFLYSLNRLNVATSRAKALAIVVASDKLLRAVPQTPDQLRMVNGLCAFVEMALEVKHSETKPLGREAPAFGTDGHGGGMGHHQHSDDESTEKLENTAEHWREGDHGEAQDSADKVAEGAERGAKQPDYGIEGK